MSHWTYLSRTCPAALLLPLEHTLHLKLPPTLTSLDASNDVFRDLFASYPGSHHGSLSLPNPESLSSSQYFNSLSFCKPFVDLVVPQHSLTPVTHLSLSPTLKPQFTNGTARSPSNILSLFDLVSHPNYSGCVILQMKEMSHPGWTVSLSVIMDLIYIKELSGICFVYGMGLNPHAYPLFVLMALLFQWHVFTSHKRVNRIFGQGVMGAI